MKTIKKPVRLAKLGFLLMLISGSSFLSSCEKNEMSPETKQNTFADDDPPNKENPPVPPTT